jgi:23S rRNA (guanosine2251-2'-O)-methyltransferase
MSDLIMGKNTVLEVLKYKPLAILEIYTAKDKNDSLIHKMQTNNIPIRFVSKNNLSLMVKSDSHQNIVAKIKDRKYLDVRDFLKMMKNQHKSIVLMLDSIFDPQNFGSILRTCECFSVDGVIFSKNRGTDITPSVTKAAAGATELLNLIKVSNLASCIDSFLDEGYSCIATTLDEDSQDMISCTFPEKMIIIMGSEGEGIQKLLLKKSDIKIHIPMSGRLQSLNVSNAAAVILSYIRFVAS